MAIEFISFESVKVDGIAAGSFVDCVANYSARRVELALACKTFHEQLASAHETALDAKEAALTTANATIARLEAEVAALSAFRPFNPRHLASTDVLLARLTQKETKAFYSSNDQIILGGQALFDEYEANGYYVDLDDANVQGLTGYMVQLGMLESMERRAVILRDATEAEAYFPPL
jgi:hypothetical protein